MSTSRVSGLTCATAPMVTRISRRLPPRHCWTGGRSSMVPAGGRPLMRPAILLSAAVVIALACAPAVQGCGGAAKHSIRVGPMPAGGTFTGVWFSPQYGEMHIEQSGATAIGRYTKDERQG